MFSSMSAPGFVQVVSDAVGASRLEVLAFGIAMLMYALLVTKRRIPQTEQRLKKVQQQDVEDPTQTEQRLKKVQKQDVEDPPRVKSTPKAETGKQNRKLVADNGVDVAKHIVMIRKFASAKNLKSAEAVFETLKDAGAVLDGLIYKTMIDACVACKNLTAADRWMDQARQAGMIDAACFNTIMKAHLANNDFEKVRSILREMKDAGIQPKPATFNEIMSSVVKCGGKRDTIWAVVDEMREAGLAPNQVTCSVLLKDLSVQYSDAEIRRTMALLNNLNEPIDEALISSVVDACVRIGRPDLLSERLTQLQNGNRLNIKSSHTFGSLIKAYGHANDLQGVWRQWVAMRRKSVRPTSNTLSCMIEALVNNNCTEDALELVQTDAQCQDVVNAAIYGLIFKGFVREKKLERVWDAYQEVEENHPEMSRAREIQACLMQT